jgi:phosphatidylglycerol:prolipoprotein diacylglycerol transferase
VFYGGLAGAAIAAAWFTRRNDMPFLSAADRLAPHLALGHAIGRVGCWLAGCCFGRPTGAAWGSRFPPEAIAFEELAARGALSPGAARTPPLHPTQLYEAGAELALFALLALLARRKPRPGLLLALYLALYALARAAIEVYRGDVARRFLVELPAPSLARALGLDPAAPLFLSTSQAIGAAALAAAAIIAIYVKRAAPTPRA